MSENKNFDRVRKLLAQADSVAGTPEADAFNARAYELIARYGIDEAAARAGRNDGPAPIIRRDRWQTGPYQPQQRILLNQLAEAIGAVCFRSGGYVISYGTATALDRLEVLFASLRLQMFNGAKTMTGHDASSTKVARRRWMEAFAVTVGQRLLGAEQAAAAEHPGAALVLVDDAKRADAEMRSNHRVRNNYSRVRANASASRAGAAAGHRADIGQDRIASRLALPA